MKIKKNTKHITTKCKQGKNLFCKVATLNFKLNVPNINVHQFYFSKRTIYFLGIWKTLTVTVAIIKLQERNNKMHNDCPCITQTFAYYLANHLIIQLEGNVNIKDPIFVIKFLNIKAGKWIHPPKIWSFASFWREHFFSLNKKILIKNLPKLDCLRNWKNGKPTFYNIHFPAASSLANTYTILNTKLLIAYFNKHKHYSSTMEYYRYIFIERIIKFVSKQTKTK